VASAAAALATVTFAADVIDLELTLLAAPLFGATRRAL
jgi:hypothetical protein